MVQQVKAYGQILQFPDGMSEADMADAISSNEHVLNPDYKPPLSDKLNALAKEHLGVDSTDVARAFTSSPSIADQAEASATEGENTAARQVPGAPVRQSTYNKALLNPQGEMPGAGIKSRIANAANEDIKAQADQQELELLRTEALKPSESGFTQSALNSAGRTIKGAGQIGSDFFDADKDNAITQYGQKLLDNNPLWVNKLEDIKDEPFLAFKEASGNSVPSMGAMVGVSAVGAGIASLAPLTGPAAPIVAAVGTVVQWLGPAAVAALPSYSGIRDAQMLKDPTNEADAKSKAIAAIGASAVGAIEVAFGPQQWAIAMLTKEGRAAMARKFASTSIGEAAIKGGLVGGTVELTEEIVQSPIEQLASYEDPTTKENLQDTAFGGAMGFLGGSLPGGVTGVASQINVNKLKPVVDAPTIDDAIVAAHEAIRTEDPTLDDLKGAQTNETQATIDTGQAQAAEILDIVLPDNTSVKAQWKIVDADQLAASMKEGVNQPRDRTRAASDVQIKSIANAPDYRRLSDSPVMDVGAPVVDQDGRIVAGNGRFAGLSQAYEQGTATEYINQLRDDAARKGLSIEGIAKPVLVRQLSEPVDTRKMAIASNSGTTLQMSALEQAKLDSERMKGIENLDVNDLGDIALTPRNLTQLKDSLGSYVGTELGAMVDKGGQLSQEGMRRVRNAMLAKAYGSSPVLEKLVESTDTDMRNVLGALTKSANHIISTKGDTKALLEAVDTYAQLKATGQPVDNFLAQQDAFSEGLSKDAEDILRFIDTNVRSQKKLTDFFKGNFREVDTKSADMFAEPVRHSNAKAASKDASWVIKNKATGEILFETFDKAKVDALNTSKYEAVPIYEHLTGLNKDERITKLEKHLKDNGYDFTVEPASVRDIDALDSTKKAAEKIAKFFKKKVVYVKADGPFSINGVMVPSIKDTIFVDIRTAKSHVAIMAHELSHWMEQENPKLYKEMLKSLKQVITDDATGEYAKKYGIDGATKAEITKEIAGDIMGDNFADESFWNKVAEANPSAFKEIAAAIIKWIKGIVVKAKSNGMGSEQWVKDATKAQDIIAKAVAQYTGESQSAGTHTGKPMFHKVFHGSPHDHNKFDSSKIGTGEGAQAYGYGHYFAESKDVAEYYKKLLVNFKKPKDLVTLESRLEKAILNDNQSQIDYFQKAIDNYPRPQGKLYEVDLAPEQDEYLLWDNPLSEQSDKVKAALGEARRLAESKEGSTGISIKKVRDDILVGEGLYGALDRAIGSQKAASEYLYSLGIRGIKYLDGTSRSKGEGAYNYVIFDDKDVSITAKFSRAPKQAGLDFGKINLDYGNIEQRPGTTEKQKDVGVSAYQALLERVANRAGAKILGLAMAKDFREQSGSSLIGKEVITPDDLATVAQVLRDPRFETFRVFYIKDGKIVHHTGLTSRLPGAVNVVSKMEGESQDDAVGRFLSTIRQQKIASRADGYYLLHNHPSGRAVPSTADELITKAIADQVPGFISHVVIDSNEYATINYNGKSNLVQRDLTGGYGTEAMIPHDALEGRVINGPASMAEVGKLLQRPKGFFTLLGLSAQNKVISIAEVPFSVLSNDGVRLVGMMRRFARNGGAHRLSVVTDADNMMQFKKAVESGVLLDVVDTDGNSLREKPEVAWPSGELFNDDKPAIRVAQFSRAPKSLADVEKLWDSKGVTSSMSERNGIITLNKILVPKDSRNAGIGTAAMRELTNYADTTNQQIALTPSADFGGNKVKLQAFYKRFGFRKNNEFNVMESMIRDPELSTVTIDGIERPTNNSEGKPIKNPVNFWRWFGDSIIVDSKGRPRVFYHGAKGGISTFDREKTIDGGFHFGTQSQSNMRVSGQGKNLIPVYLSASNLQRSKDLGGNWKVKIKSARLSGRDGIVYLNRYEGLSTEVIQRLSDDGLLDKLDRMTDAEFRRAVPEAEDSYIVFDPNQIKSAIGNNGDYSKTNNDIRFSRAPTTKSFRDWFGDSKVVDEQGRPRVVYHGTSKDISVFNPDEGEGKTYGTGSFFSSNPDTSATYTGGVNGGNIMPVYLRMENPAVLDAQGANWNRLNKNTRVTLPEVTVSAQADEDLLAELEDRTPDQDATRKLKARNTTLGRLLPDDFRYADDYGSTDDIARWARQTGYDGLIINNVVDQGPTGNFANETSSEPSTIYVVYDANQVKSATGNNGEYSRTNNDIRFSKEPTKPTPPDESRLRRFQRMNQDSFNRFTVIKEWLAENGQTLSDKADVHGAEERYQSMAANQLEDFREQQRNPLIEKIQKAGYTLGDIEVFLKMQHTQEANAQIRKLGGDTAYGITDDEAVDYLAEAPENLAKLANEFRDITEQTKKLRLDAGILNTDITDAWEGAYKHYVPVKGEADSTRGVGKGLKTNFKSKRRLGHSLRDEHVIENILMDHERAILEVERNRVGKHLVMMAAEMQRPDILSIEQPEKRKVLKTDTAYTVEANGVVQGVFKSREEAKMFKQFYAASMPKVAPSAIVINQTKDQRVIASASPMLAENEVNVYMNGHTIRVQINDELLARAYTKMGVEQFSDIVAAGRILNGYLSKVYTGYNPEFILTNMVRDFSSGTINLTGEQGFGMATKALTNYPRMFVDLLKYAATNGRSSTKWIDSYRANGGNTGAAYLSDMERLGNEVSTEYASYQGVIANIKQGDNANAARAAGRKVFNATLKWIYNLNQAGENAMRLAAFKAMLDSGRTVNEAAKVAKNITVNFNRKGERQWAPALYLFYNASIQGTAATGHALFKGKHKGQAWALASGMAAVGYMMAASFGGGDEDDWDEINEYTKERNMLIKSGDGYVKVPVPYGYGFFWNLGRHMADAQRTGELGKLPWHLATSAISEFTPFNDVVVGSDEEFRSDQVFMGFLPTAMKIVAQPVFNKQLFTGNELMPESQFDKSQPDRQKMFRSTKGTMYDEVAGWLDSAGIDVSPETLKYAVRTGTGGAGSLVDTSISAAMLKAEGAELDTQEIPFVRKAYMELGIKDKRAAYYKVREEARTAAEEFNRARRDNDVGKMQDVLKDKKELIALDRYANKLAATIDAARDQQDAVRADKKLSVREKRMKLKDMEATEAKFYDKYLDVFKTTHRP